MTMTKTFHADYSAEAIADIESEIADFEQELLGAPIKRLSTKHHRRLRALAKRSDELGLTLTQSGVICLIELFDEIESPPRAIESDLKTAYEMAIWLEARRPPCAKRTRPSVLNDKQVHDMLKKINSHHHFPNLPAYTTVQGWRQSSHYQIRIASERHARWKAKHGSWRAGTAFDAKRRKRMEKRAAINKAGDRTLYDEIESIVLHETGYTGEHVTHQSIKSWVQEKHGVETTKNLTVKGRKHAHAFENAKMQKGQKSEK